MTHATATLFQIEARGDWLMIGSTRYSGRAYLEGRASLKGGSTMTWRSDYSITYSDLPSAASNCRHPRCRLLRLLHQLTHQQHHHIDHRLRLTVLPVVQYSGCASCITAAREYGNQEVAPSVQKRLCSDGGYLFGLNLAATISTSAALDIVAVLDRATSDTASSTPAYG